MASISSETLEQKLDRLIAAVARLAPEVATPADLEAADCFVWTAERGVLEPPRIRRRRGAITFGERVLHRLDAHLATARAHRLREPLERARYTVDLRCVGVAEDREAKAYSRPITSTPVTIAIAWPAKTSPG